MTDDTQNNIDRWMMVSEWRGKMVAIADTLIKQLDDLEHIYTERCHTVDDKFEKVTAEIKVNQMAIMQEFKAVDTRIDKIEIRVAEIAGTTALIVSIVMLLLTHLLRL